MKITEADKLAIVTARAAGVSVNELAKRYAVSRQTISAVLARLKNGKHAEAKKEFDATVYRSRLCRKAYVAVEAGLDDASDSYKRANVGTTTLKGLGEFEPDTRAEANVTIFLQQIRSLPPDLRQHYLGLDTLAMDD